MSNGRALKIPGLRGKRKQKGEFLNKRKLAEARARKRHEDKMIAELTQQRHTEALIHAAQMRTITHVQRRGQQIRNLHPDQSPSQQTQQSGSL